VWQARRRLRQLEQEVAQARAAQAALQERVQLFEAIAAAAGASLDERARDPAAPASPGQPPATLLAAAAEPASQGSPVRLAVDGRDVIAVVGDEGGDPREWWAAIRRLGSGSG
jgi:hypothetical protein